MAERPESPHNRCRMLNAAVRARAFARAAGLALVVAAPAAAQGRQAEHARFLAEARAMMTALRAESVDSAARIAAAYGEGAAGHAFHDREEVAAALNEGFLAPFPLTNNWFNVRPRLTGSHPIGEKDLGHQALYVAARPATLGVLLRIAARVRTPLEVTSLVRHQAYQQALARTNPNARTDVPMHTLGLAFDLSILNIPVPAARELRDVLRQMRDEGDLYFVAEVRQLVFHVVPAPERQDFYAAVFDGLRQVPAPSWTEPSRYPRWLSVEAAPPVLPDTLIDRAASIVARGGAPLPVAAFSLAALTAALGASRRLRRTSSTPPDPVTAGAPIPAVPRAAGPTRGAGG